MGNNHSVDNLLLSLLKKILLYRLTRNIDKELQNRKISHAKLSAISGRGGNWFNRAFNELEDMRVTTFIRTITAINKKTSGRDNNPVDVNHILDEELFKISSVFIDLATNGAEYLLNNDPEIRQFFRDIKFYVDALKALDSVLSAEELQSYEQILNRISTERM